MRLASSAASRGPLTRSTNADDDPLGQASLATADLEAELLNASRVTPATRALIALLAARFGEPTPEQVFAIGRLMLPARGLASPGRQALRAQVITRSALYFRQFARPGWRLIAAAGPAQRGTTPDLLWQRERHLEIDQIEPGRLRAADLKKLRDRSGAQLEAAVDHYGPAVVRLRLLVLTRPDQSFELRP